MLSSDSFGQLGLKDTITRWVRSVVDKGYNQRVTTVIRDCGILLTGRYGQLGLVDTITRCVRSAGPEDTITR